MGVTTMEGNDETETKMVEEPKTKCDARRAKKSLECQHSDATPRGQREQKWKRMQSRIFLTDHGALTA